MADEEEYFKRLDSEAKARLKAKLDAESAVEAVALRRDTHFHKCGKYL